MRSGDIGQRRLANNSCAVRPGRVVHSAVHRQTPGWVSCGGLVVGCCATGRPGAQGWAGGKGSAGPDLPKPPTRKCTSM